MKSLKHSVMNSIGFITSRPWLALLLVPVFYGSFRTPQRSWVLRSITQVLPAEVQIVGRKSEQEIAKLAHSIAWSLMLGVTLHALNLKHESSQEN